MTFFTADQHYSSERHLELCRRPFSSVEEMDKEMIRIHNQMTKDNDFVIHVGDFGNFDILKQLKGIHYIILGNYEEKEMEEKFDNNFTAYTEYLQTKGFEKVIRKNLELNFRLENSFIDLNITHMPEDCIKTADFNLFGHIHATRQVAKYGLNVGVDAHHFKLVSSKDVEFFKTAIEKYYDKNVFM